MRTPVRKANKRPLCPKDYHISQKKYTEIEKEIKVLKEKRPKLAAEVKRLAEMGDFSENAGYQLAKSRLRGLNNKILDLNDRLKKAEIINKSTDTSIIKIGHTVILELNQEQKTYTILGSSESDPSRGIISYLSPLGSLLLRRKIGDSIMLNNREYRIVDIE